MRMLGTALSRACIATKAQYNAIAKTKAKIQNRSFSFEDNGRMRCRLKTERFQADLMPLPQKKKYKSTEEMVLDAEAIEYNENQQLLRTVGPSARYDDLYYKCTRQPRNYTQTWVEGPEPTVKENVFRNLDEYVDPAPIEKRNKNERPGTAKPISSHNRRFHSWYKKHVKQFQQLAPAKCSI